MNTPNRNTVVQMTLDWIAWHGGDVHMGLYDELGHMYFNGEAEHYISDVFWESMEAFKEYVWDKHVSAQFDFMQLWHDELDTDIYTIDWLFTITNEYRIPFELPIIAGFMAQEADAFGQRVKEVQENEASLIKVQALVRGRNTRWRIPCFGFDKKITDYDAVSLFPSAMGEQ